jgi:prophage regulatory protein
MNNHESKNSQEAILRLKEVKSRTGLSRSTIYLAVKNDLFPKPIKLGLRSVGWVESEINTWILSRIKNRMS